jgi:hypothetical protein
MLSENILWFVISLSLIVIGLTVSLLRLSALVRKNQEIWNHLLGDTTTGNLELILKDHLRERLALQSSLEDARRQIAGLEAKMATSKRHVGLVRYDAYPDVGGSQSFALAVYDDHGNGAIVNGLVGRLDCRVYCKPLVAGKSDRSLSVEETRAIEDAVSRESKAMVTS